MIYRYVFSFVVLLVCSSVVSLAQFGSAPDFPAGPTDGCFSFVIGDVAYVGGGVSSPGFYTFHREKREWGNDWRVAGKQGSCLGICVLL